MLEITDASTIQEHTDAAVLEAYQDPGSPEAHARLIEQTLQQITSAESCRLVSQEHARACLQDLYTSIAECLVTKAQKDGVPLPHYPAFHEIADAFSGEVGHVLARVATCEVLDTADTQEVLGKLRAEHPTHMARQLSPELLQVQKQLGIPLACAYAPTAPADISDAELVRMTERVAELLTKKLPG